MINYDWRAFLALEDDFLKTLDFVEFHENNYKTFSIRYRSIILQACTEIESIAKQLYKGSEKYNLFNFIKWNYKEREGECLSSIEISLPLFNDKFFPWKGRLSENVHMPHFWSAYNDIKHERKIESATLENTRDSIGALFSLLLIRYSKDHSNGFSQKFSSINFPKAFDYPGLQPCHMITEDSCKISIPF